MSNKRDIPASDLRGQLRAAAVEIDGAKWVRAAAVLRIMGLGPGWYGALPRRWCVAELRRPTRPRRGASLGTEIYWSLDAVLRFCRSRATVMSHRPWTRDDDETLAGLLRHVTIGGAGKAMGRSFRAVLHRISRLGGLRNLWLATGLITSGDLMRITRKRAYDTIARWRRMGLPATRSPGGKDMLFSLPDVRTFFMAHPRLLITLDSAARKLLRVTTADIEAWRAGRAA